MKKVSHYSLLVWLAFISALSLFFTSAWLCTGQGLRYSELPILRAIYGLPQLLLYPFAVITLVGTIWMPLCIVIWLLLRKRIVLAAVLGVACVTTYGLVELTKQLVLRGRPETLTTDITQKLLYTSGNGFPSGHTALAAVITTTACLVVPKKTQPILLLMVVLVGLSRIYLGAHAPLDVIGGAALGTVVGLCFYPFRPLLIKKAK